MKVVGNAIVIDSGVIGQLIDQPLHIVSLVVDRSHILVDLLRCICHTIHNSGSIAFDRGDRRLQIM